jgi:TolB-like protein/DNA-binding winged helix-turn-helix (wHTH) protein
MEHPSQKTLRIGDWSVNPASGHISKGEESVRVEARTMRLLLCLAEHAGEVVSIDELLRQVWSGVVVTPDSVYQAVTSLRRLLRDDPKQPTYIATVPRLGYRMIAAVDSKIDELAALPVAAPRTPGPQSRRPVLLAAGALLLAGCVMFYLFAVRGSAPPAAVGVAGAANNPKTIAVLPFLDLTDRMNEEAFADGMTEELIDRLSRVRGLRVPPPTSSFYFKGKKMTVAAIAKSLGVAYVLDGSVRKSGAMLRVAARLVRADDGYIVWSETYDRPLDDKLMVQDDIASEVTKALRASIT